MGIMVYSFSYFIMGNAGYVSSILLRFRLDFGTYVNVISFIRASGHPKP